MKPTLIYVDDEIENLKVFTRVFKKDFTIHTAESGEDGLKLFENHPETSLLVSDQRMPGMSGVDFLNACKLIDPNPIRILITGYADLESTINAINDAEIYRFIKKPWEKLDLLQTLTEAFKKFNLEKELQQKNQELMSLDKLKTKFMMLVNHELKTPLTIQQSYLQLLEDSPLDEDQKNYLSKSLNGSKRLEKLINEILFFLKVQKEDLNNQEETFELSEATGVHDLTGVRIKTHRTYFCNAINRLVENAETHKKEGSSLDIQTSSNEVVISNESAEPINVNLILKPFELHEDAFNHSKGLGLGLSIATLIFNKLGFKVEIQSDTKFIVKIDLTKHHVS